MLIGTLLFVLLGVMAVKTKKRGLCGGEVAVSVVIGAVCILVAMFGILLRRFSGFG